MKNDGKIENFEKFLLILLYLMKNPNKNTLKKLKKGYWQIY